MKGKRGFRLRRPHKVLLAVALAASLAGLTPLPLVRQLFQGIEDRALDYGFLLRGQRESGHLPIVLVLIDDESLFPYGYRSPTPRPLLADLVTQLGAKGVRCAGFDFVLDRPLRPEDDDALESALRSAPMPVVLVDPALPRFADISLMAFSSVEGSALQTVHWYRLLDDSGSLPSFAWALAERCFGETSVPEGVASQGPVLLNYYGPASDTEQAHPVFPVLRASEVRHVPPEFFQGRVVLVGSGLRDLGDIFLTPFSTRESGFRETFGVELHAIMLGTLLDQIFLIPGHPMALAALAFLLYAVAALVTLLLPTQIALAAGFLALLSWPLWTVSAFVFYSAVYPSLYPVLFGAAAIFICEVVLQLTEARQARFLQRTFSRYLSPTLVEEMSDRGWRMDLGGESRVVTIFFSDLEGFTTLSERMSPGQVVQLLNEYLGVMTEELFAQQGTIGDFIGDAIMAYFGAPVATPDHASRACQSALRMQAALGRLNPGWAKRGLPELRMRIGIHTGEVVLGNIGSERRMDFTVIGDAVNLASRLEGANKVFGTSILASGETLAETAGQFVSRELGRIIVKGKSKPVVLHELIGEWSGDTGDGARRSIHHVYAGALEAFYAGRIEQAQDLFKQAAEGGDEAAKFMVMRCKTLQDRPLPEQWEGTLELRSK